MLDVTKIIIRELANSDNCNSSLLVGPGNKTTELQQLNYLKDHKLTYPESLGIDDCKNCPYNILCNNGYNIKNGKLCYKKQSFDSIFLRADSSIKEDSLLNQAKYLLKNQGSLMFFIDPKFGDTKSTLSNFCFGSEAILNKINSTQLSIELIKKIRFSKYVCAFCVVVNKSEIFS